MTLLILILLALPMVVVYDKDEKTRFLTCGLFYYLTDAFFKKKRGRK